MCTDMWNDQNIWCKPCREGKEDNCTVQDDNFGFLNKLYEQLCKKFNQVICKPISSLSSQPEYCKQWSEGDLIFWKGWSAFNTPSTDGFKNPFFFRNSFCLGWPCMLNNDKHNCDQPGLTWQRGGVVWVVENHLHTDATLNKRAI